MGCKSSKIQPERKIMGLFEVLSRVETMYYKHKYSKNSYKDDMALIELKDYCIKARHVLKDSFMPEEVRKWLLSRVSLYETITIKDIKHTGVHFADDIHDMDRIVTSNNTINTSDITPPLCIQYCS
jgi:hypothetical protein